MLRKIASREVDYTDTALLGSIEPQTIPIEDIISKTDYSLLVLKKVLFYSAIDNYGIGKTYELLKVYWFHGY